MKNAIESAPAQKVADKGISPVVENAQPRSVVLASLTFQEACDAAIGSAHWNDVLRAADSLKDSHDAAVQNEKTVSAIARRIGATAPKSTAMFRFAIVSYSLSGRLANDTQRAELAAKLPGLKKAGSLKDTEITFGGLVLPKLIGNL